MILLQSIYCRAGSLLINVIGVIPGFGSFVDFVNGLSCVVSSLHLHLRSDLPSIWCFVLFGLMLVKVIERVGSSKGQDNFESLDQWRPRQAGRRY